MPEDAPQLPTFYQLLSMPFSPCCTVLCPALRPLLNACVCRSDDAEPNSKRARQSVPDPAAGAPAAAQGDSQGAGPSGAQSSPAQGPSSAAGAPQTPSGTATPGTLGRPSSGKPGGGGVAPLNPLALHRSFCPWVAAADAAGGAAGRDARIGWRWCLDVLVPAAGPEEGEEGGAGADGATAFSRLDPAAKLRALLRKLGV